MARRNGVKTVKLQLTIDETTDRILDEMVSLGIHGATKAEVGTWVIRNWLWSNQESLRVNEINFKKSNTES